MPLHAGRHAAPFSRVGNPLPTSSDAGVPTGKIAQLVGHSSTTTTERVYRNQIRPVVQGGAQVMDNLFVKPGSSDA
jgi:integrase